MTHAGLPDAPPPVLAPVRAAGGKRPRVSVVMPTYKRPHTIGDSLRTVLAQTFRDIEVIVMADGIDDQTGETVRSFGDPRVSFSVNTPRKGIPGILNDLISRTVGEYVIVLHDHDRFEPDLLEAMVAVLDAHPSVLYVHTGLTMFDPDTGWERRYVSNWAEVTAGKEWRKFMLSRYDSPVCAESMVRRSAYESFGLYDERFGFWSDIEMWMRLALQGDVGYVRACKMHCPIREPGHEYRRPRWQPVEALVQIHRRHGAKGRSSGVSRAFREERLRLRTLLSVMKHDWRSRDIRAEARSYLRRTGGPLTRFLARAIP